MRIGLELGDLLRFPFLLQGPAQDREYGAVLLAAMQRAQGRGELKFGHSIRESQLFRSLAVPGIRGAGRA